MMRTITSVITRTLVVISILALALAGASAGVASAAPSGATAVPAWCPLGKAHKGGKGCRGGSLVPNVDVGGYRTTVGAVTVNCSIGTCSIYVSRSATKELNERGDLLVDGSTGLVAALGLSGPLGVVVGAAVGVNSAVARDAIKQAAETHGAKGACFKMTKPHFPSVGGFGMVANSYTHYSTNNGKYCKD